MYFIKINKFKEQKHIASHKKVKALWLWSIIYKEEINREKIEN